MQPSVCFNLLVVDHMDDHLVAAKYSCKTTFSLEVERDFCVCNSDQLNCIPVHGTLLPKSGRAALMGRCIFLVCLFLLETLYVRGDN